MIGDELKYRIMQSLSLEPTPEQATAARIFADFMTARQSQVAMVLRGSAGTGKTTLAGAIVRAMAALRQKMVLLAPTGRAAKVFSLYAGHPAYTIHRRIYRQQAAGAPAMERASLSAFNLNTNLQRDTLFIIDEASMISNSGYGDSAFGSGCLLDDLMRYVYNDQNCRLLFIGDSAQLPPVGEVGSPALQTSVLRGYGMQVFEASLTTVLRQSQASGILFNANAIRLGLMGEGAAVPRIRLNGFSDIRVVPGDELIESLSSSYSRAGIDDTIVITRSNKRANIYNQGIRTSILDREDQLCRGDQLMIVRNNYFWQLNPQQQGGFIANGDVATVQRVKHIHEQYGFHFAEVVLCFPDYDDCELTCMVILDTLTSESPALTHEQQQLLYERIMTDYADLPLKADRLKQLKQDRYYNALQVKFAYAVTCHKAQGGQWSEVYIDQGYMTDDMLSPDYFHWLYTAFTRATGRLFLVNWPAAQVDATNNQ